MFTRRLCWLGSILFGFGLLMLLASATAADLDQARLRALLRRQRPQANNVLRLADLELDLITRQVRRSGQVIDLKPKEFALLEYFLRNPDRVLTRTNMAERVWGLLFEEESNVIEVYVSRLRRKVDRGFDKQLIHTIIGTGYILSADIKLACNSISTMSTR